MKEITVKNRHRLKKKDALKVMEQLSGLYGIEVLAEDLEMGSTQGSDFVIKGDQVIAFYFKDRIALSIRGALALSPKKGFVTVDMGAVKFISSGADVMGPGILDADEGIEEGEPVWVREVSHLKPLAIGLALRSGPELKAKTPGKAVKTLHFIGDPLWNATM